jgi:hypothetical protein
MYGISDFFSDAADLLQTAIKESVKAVGDEVIKGTISALNEGYRSLGEISGTIEGRLVQTTGGWNISSLGGKILGKFIVNNILDAIEGPGEELPLTWIPIPIPGADIILDIFGRYHKAGGDLDCSGRDADYCRLLRDGTQKLNNVPLVPEIQELQSYTSQTFKK